MFTKPRYSSTLQRSPIMRSPVTLSGAISTKRNYMPSGAMSLLHFIPCIVYLVLRPCSRQTPGMRDSSTKVLSNRAF